MDLIPLYYVCILPNGLISTQEIMSQSEKLMAWKPRFMRDAVAKGLIGEETPLAVFWNLTEFKRQIDELITAFPSHFLHTFATKANPLERILIACKEFGLGAEAASIGELELALRVQPDPTRVMLDSPTKTRKEIERALLAGVGLTIDNLIELERVAEIRDGLISSGKLTDSNTSKNIGIRINPQLGIGLIATTSVSKAYGKFGVPIEQKDELLSVYEKYPWLNMVHVHAGSQAYGLETIAKGIRIATDLALTVNERVGKKQVETIDIGGGIITNFKSEDNTPCFKDWSGVLKKTVPELFTGEFRVITEYGRRLLAKQGVIVSKVEYTKVAGGRRVILQHAGADLCVRTVYKPDAWPIRITGFKSNGMMFDDDDDDHKGESSSSEELSSSSSSSTSSSSSSSSSCPMKADVAGPCCIDDVLEPRERDLPDLKEGDYIMIHDTGAYYHSSWSYYNCRQSPALYCFEEPKDDDGNDDDNNNINNNNNNNKNNNKTIIFEEIRPMGSVEDTISFFYTKSTKKI